MSNRLGVDLKGWGTPTWPTEHEGANVGPEDHTVRGGRSQGRQAYTPACPPNSPARQTEEGQVRKAEFIDAVADRSGLDRVAAAAAVDAIFGVESGVILRALQAGEPVRLDGFGVFEARRRSERMGRNPSTGETIRIPAHAAPAFRAGQGLKRGVRAG